MSSWIIRKTLANWYNLYASMNLGPLRSYVTQVELLVNGSVRDFKKHKTTEEIGNDEEDQRVVEVYMGLDDESYHIKSIFEEVLPNLHRQAALITLFSFLERELNDLCDLFYNELNNRIALGDLRDKGIDRARLYLAKVAGLQLGESNGIWSEIKNIQILRNLIAHNGGVFATEGNRREQAVKRYIDRTNSLSSVAEVQLERGFLKQIIVQEGFLHHVLDVFDRYFKQIDDAIQGTGAKST